METKDYLRKLSDIKYNVVRTFASNEHYLNMAMSFAGSISKFAESKSPLSFIEGGVNVFNLLVRATTGKAKDYFNEDNGWKQLTGAYYNRYFYDILSSVIENYPSKELKFGTDNEKPILFELPIGTLAKLSSGLYYQVGKSSKKEILDFLISEKMKTLDSKLFLIAEKSFTSKSGGESVFRYDLISEEIVSLPSKYASDLSEYIKAFLAKGFTRSMILNGLPGSGKSVAVHAIIKELGLNTLKFKYKRDMDHTMMQF